MATNSSAKPEPQHPPLARDPQGNLVSVPDGTAAWRICRNTLGRPKEIVGPDKRTLRLPLDTTPEDLADLCGPDVYRLYALDEVGKPIDYVVTVDVTRDAREHRNAAAPDASQLPALRAMPMAATSDLRFALEAMAHMMRVNSDALRAVTESQAESLKAIASVRGFFRNAMPPVPPPPPSREEDDDDGDEDDDDEELPRSKTIFDVLAPIAEHVAPAFGPLASMVAGGAGRKVLGAARAPAGAEPALAGKPTWEFRDFVDLRYAAAKGKAKKDAKQASDSGAANAAKPSLQARVMADPKLVAHFMAINAQLDPDEARQLLGVGESITEEQQGWLLAQVSALSAADAAALLRTMLRELRATNPSGEGAV